MLNENEIKKQVLERLQIPEPVSIRYLMRKYKLKFEHAKIILIDLNIPHEYSGLKKNLKKF